MKKIISILSSSLLIITANAQINIGSNQPPDSSAMLQISGTTKGFLPPRMSHDSMMLINNPAKGLMVFNTTDSTLYMRRDSGWTPLGGNGFWLSGNKGIFNSDSTQNVGIGTSAPLARLHVLDSSVLFSADGDVSWSYNETSAISGEGRRVMWLPSKAAFRAGGVYGNLWDIDSTGYYSFAAGVDAEAKGDMSVAMGYGPIATGYGATAFGIYTVASGDASFAACYGTASGGSSFAVNSNTKAIGDGSAAFGYNTTAYGYYSAAFGEQSNPSGEASFAAGFATAASGQYSFASGYVSGASGLGSTAMGFFNNSSATYTVTMGGHCTASADYSTAFGEGATASGLYANAFGGGATASGRSSLSLGQSTVASGTSSTALGTGDSAKGDYSNTFGYGTIANGQYSFAVGISTTAGGDYSTAMGTQTSAPSGFETVAGAFNTAYIPLSTTGWNPLDRLFTIGNGTSASATNDAMVVLKNGNIGIGNSLPTDKLDVTGNIVATGTVTGINILSLSDARFKKDIQPLSYSLDAVMKLKGVSWHWKTAEFRDKGFTNAKQIGFIAQDVEKVVPEVVLTDAKGYKGIDYAKLTAVLTEAVKAQQQEIAELKKEVAANTMQQQTIDALTQRLSQLEASMAQKSSAVKTTESR